MMYHNVNGLIIIGDDYGKPSTIAELINYADELDTSHLPLIEDQAKIAGGLAQTLGILAKMIRKEAPIVPKNGHHKRRWIKKKRRNQ